MGGGDTLITQSAPTNFHGFWTRKLLNKGETVADFREITSAEMESLKAADAKWTRPPQSFIDLWNAACGQYGKYNEDTGYFELNGLLDITYEQALEIYRAGVLTNDTHTCKYGSLHIRTHLPSQIHVSIAVCEYTFYASHVEVVNAANLIPDEASFYNCGKLRKITVYSPCAANRPAQTTYKGCIALEEINITKMFAQSVWLGDSPLLSLATVKGFVEKATGGTAPITITLHPEVYAKLTDADGHPEWASVIELAASTNKQINFTTV